MSIQNSVCFLNMSIVLERNDFRCVHCLGEKLRDGSLTPSGTKRNSHSPARFCAKFYKTRNPTSISALQMSIVAVKSIFHKNVQCVNISLLSIFYCGTFSSVWNIDGLEGAHSLEAKSKSFK